MSTPCYFSIHICMCQSFPTQKNSSPEGDRPGVYFTPFQYKQNIENLKLAIEAKSIAKIPTSESGSESPQLYWIMFSQNMTPNLPKAHYSLHLASIQLHQNHTAGVKNLSHKNLES
ncbi:hypothetical protein O181_032892 [Austropuccinia psidii MF-1]|uniref:Uncharacterized protein n=1 Tax=Austropuccinia psidii MF-1 TaxID=1389203 RepID=A0A9Q3D0B9_9BASI|nr:hypothetical protein [Austropuccinia psidii MF-1]